MKIDKVFDLAKEGHKNQFRKDNVTPYINHPIQICRKLKELDITKHDMEDELNVSDFVYYAIALMHDLLEDTNITYQQIKEASDSDSIADCVEKLTCRKDANNPFYKMNYMKEIVESDEKVLIIKCVDRICNVYDFLKSGDYKYAKTYFHKADILWNAVYEKYAVEYEKLWKEILKIDNSFKANRNERKIDQK